MGNSAGELPCGAFTLWYGPQGYGKNSRRWKRFTLSVENESYMPLVIESWSTPDALKGERRRVLVAHYYNWGNTNIQTLSWK